MSAFTKKQKRTLADKARVTRIKLGILRLDFQPAECLIEENVRVRMQQIADGRSLEPIVVRFDGESYFVQDGIHKVEAARRCGLTEIDAEISAGSLAEMEAEFRELLEAVKADLRRGRAADSKRDSKHKK